MLLPWAPADMLDLSSSTPEPPAEYYQVWSSTSDPRPVCLVASGTFSIRFPDVTRHHLNAEP
jgi:hypothetical protein